MLLQKQTLLFHIANPQTFMVKMLFLIRLLSTFLHNIHTLWDSSNLPKTRPEPFIAPYTEHATVIGISTTAPLITYSAQV